MSARSAGRSESSARLMCVCEREPAWTGEAGTRTATGKSGVHFLEERRNSGAVFSFTRKREALTAELMTT